MDNLIRPVCELYGWSVQGMARLLRRDPRDFRRMALGKKPLDPDLLAWLTVLAAHPPPARREQPLPEGWDENL